MTESKETSKMQTEKT